MGVQFTRNVIVLFFLLISGNINALTHVNSLSVISVLEKELNQ